MDHRRKKMIDLITNHIINITLAHDLQYKDKMMTNKFKICPCALFNIYTIGNLAILCFMAREGVKHYQG